MIGEIGKGYKIAIETLNEGRIGIGAQMVGLAQGALDHALAYAKQRKQFGKADQRISRRAVRSGRNGGRSRSRAADGATTPLACAMPGCRLSLKPPCANISRRRWPSGAPSTAVEVLGGVGFTKDYPVEKLYRDAKIGRIYEGTSNMQRVTIAKQIAGKPKLIVHRR